MNLDHYPGMTQRDPNWHKTSKRLHEFLNRDFRSIQKEILPKLFPRSHGRRLARDLPVVWSFSKELTPHYRRPPTRTFIDGDASTSVIARVYDGLRINTVMKRLTELLVTQGTVIGLFRPVSGRNRWHLDLFPPYMCEIDPDPTDSANIQAAREIRFKVALEATHDRVRYGTLRITPDRAEYVGQKVSGVYTDDGRMPFDMLPVFVARLGGVEHPGSVWSALPLELHDAQISISVAMADWQYVALNTSHGQRVISGLTPERAQELQFGADTVIGLDSESSFNVVSPTSNLADYIASTTKFWDMLRVTYGLRPQDYTRAVTAVAKRIEMIDRDAHQEELTNALIDCENDMAAVAASVLSWNFGANTGTIKAPRVQMGYNKIELPADILHQSQADQLGASLGITSPSRLVASRMGVPLAEARQIVKENLEEYRQVQGGGSDG